MTIFVMEKDLRSLKDREHFPIPTITPHGTRIENPHQVSQTLEAVDEEMVHILTTVRESERNYEKEKEEARVREQQARTTRSSQRPEYNFLTLNSSTPIKIQVQQETRTDTQREAYTSTQTPYGTTTP